MTARATTDTMLAMVRRLVRDNSTDFASSDLLELANHEMHGSLVPAIAELNQDYFRYTTTYTGDGTTREWTIPARAVANRLVSALVTNVGGRDYPLTIGSKNDLLARRTGSSGSSDRPHSWLYNDRLVTSMPLSAGLSLAIDTFIRPGDLIDTSSAKQVITVNAGSLVLSGTSPVATGVLFDIIANRSPFRHIGIDQTATVAGSTLTFTPPSGVQVGDWVAPAQQSPIPQIPYECHPALYELVAGRVFSLLSDATASQLHASNAADIMKAVVPMLAPRVVEQPTKLLDGESIDALSDFFYAYNP